MTRRITDIVTEGQALGVVGGVAASVPVSDDQTAAEVPFTSAGNIAATNVQAALVELDTEKAAKDPDGLTVAEQATNPATPAFGYGRLFAKADGLYFIDDAGVVTGPLGAGGGGAIPGAWTTYTPTLTQSTSVPHTVNRAKWVQIGKTVHVSVYLTVTGAGGTAGNTVLLSLPVASILTGLTIGSGRVYDDSAVAVYRGVAVLNSASVVRIEGGNTTAGGGLGGPSQPFSVALALNDIVEFTATYEVA